MTAPVVDVNPRTRDGPADGRLSWPVLFLTLAAVTSSSLAALSLCQLLALRAEVESLKSDVCRRREEQQEKSCGDQNFEQMCSRRRLPEPLSSPHLKSQPVRPLLRKRRMALGPERSVSQPFLQLLADINRETFQKEFASETYTSIPWQVGLRRGSALEVESNLMLVREEGYYFVYSQVYYKDKVFAMGHVVIRRKRNVVGDEPQYVTLLRCIQNMNPKDSYNTCYTGGIARLEVGDQVELLIPRPTANVSLDGGSTFLGAVKLA